MNVNEGKQAILCCTSLDEGYEALQNVVLNDDYLSINEKAERLTELQLAYEALTGKAKAV